MPTWCTVSFCGNRSDKTSDVSYHMFPKNEEEKKLWIIFCKRGLEWVPSSTSRICSSHFRKIDFERNLQSELIGGVSRRILERGAVPSIINDSGEEQSGADENKDNKVFMESVIRNIDKEEKERKCLVTKIMEEAREEQVPSTSSGNQDSALITQSPEELNLDYKTLYSILLQENNALQIQNSQLSKENQQTQWKLKVSAKRLHSYRKKLLIGQMREKKIKDILRKVLSNNQIDLLLKKKKRVNWKPAEIATAFTLMYYSKKSYLYLKNHLHYPLPSLSSLERWAM